MNILSFFVIVPLIMLLGLWLAKGINQVRADTMVRTAEHMLLSGS